MKISELTQEEIEFLEGSIEIGRSNDNEIVITGLKADIKGDYWGNLEGRHIGDHEGDHHGYHYGDHYGDHHGNLVKKHPYFDII